MVLRAYSSHYTSDGIEDLRVGVTLVMVLRTYSWSYTSDTSGGIEDLQLELY